jgi:hypothetical protein
MSVEWLSPMDVSGAAHGKSALIKTAGLYSATPPFLDQGAILLSNNVHMLRQRRLAKAGNDNLFRSVSA